MDKQEETKEKICDTLIGKKRYLNLTDLFAIRCKKCNSDDVYLSSDECEECGSFISAECNKCGLAYNYHDFKNLTEDEIRQLLSNK